MPTVRRRTDCVGRQPEGTLFVFWPWTEWRICARGGRGEGADVWRDQAGFSWACVKQDVAECRPCRSLHFQHA